jgi:malonate decarboxylase gamma subunit
MDLSAMARIMKIPLETLAGLAQSHPVFAPGPENYLRMGGIQEIWKNNLASCLMTAFADISNEDLRMSHGAATRWACYGTKSR